MPPRVTDEQIGARLKEARESAGLSINEAAKLRGIDSRIVMVLEDGGCPLTPQDIIAFCEMYEVGYDWLLGIWTEDDLPDDLVEMCERLPPFDRRKLLRVLASYGNMY
jgi:transcriptional regulator with XRE-family HTH domain